jgi:hypothetical protein
MKRSEMIKALKTEHRDYLDDIDLAALLDFLEARECSRLHIKRLC